MDRLATEKHRRLSSRVAAADDDDLRFSAVARFVLRRSIIDAGIFEFAQPIDRRPPILNPSGYHDGPAADAPPVYVDLGIIAWALQDPIRDWRSNYPL